MSSSSYSSCSIVVKSLQAPQNLHRPLKTCPVFLLGTENVMGVSEDSGSDLWYFFLVKCVVKFVIKLKKYWIGTKIGVVVDMDPPIMIVVCGKICGKNVWQNLW